jgi:Uma2 family endonuclease
MEAIKTPAASRRLPISKMTYEQFLQWLDEDTWAEWVDGEVFLMSPVSGAHQDMALFLLRLISEFVETRDLGVVRYEPFQMKTGSDLPGRSPDILYVAKENLHRLRETHLDGPADLVVEVISEESRARDKGEKFSEYERGGVREYWLIDPARRQAEFYVLQDGAFQPASSDNEGIYRSTVLPGFWMRVDWLWQRPPISQVTKQWL